MSGLKEVDVNLVTTVDAANLQRHAVHSTSSASKLHSGHCHWHLIVRSAAVRIRDVIARVSVQHTQVHRRFIRQRA